MKKSDLKNRMVVECRNGDRYMVIDDMLLSTTGFMRLLDYDLNLKCVTFDEFDIIKVYKEIRIFDFDIANNNNIIWDRFKIKEVTMSEIEEKFGCQVKIVNE